MRRSGWASVTLVAVTIVLASASLALATAGPGGLGTEPGTFGEGPPDLTNVTEPALVYDVELTRTGNATWTVAAVFPTGTDEEAAAFDRIATEYQAEGGEGHLPVRPYERTVDQAAEELDRPMAIADIERSVERDEHVGQLVLSFSWTGFAVATDERVHHGDVYATTEGGWFASLEEGEYLRVHPPANYTVERSGGPVDNRTMWLAGPTRLSPDSLSATFVDPAAYHEPAERPPSDGESMAMPLLLVGVSVLTLLVAVALVVVDRRPDELVGDALGSLPATLAGAVGVPRMGSNGEVEGPEEPEEPAPQPLEDPELLSDEERVLGLLERSGGRMKQGKIVEETDWSNAKVSQLLSELAEDDRIEKLRIGRENLILLPGETADDGDGS